MRIFLTLVILISLSVHSLNSQAKYLEKDQTLVGFALGYSHSKSVDARTGEIAASPDGTVAISASFSRVSPGHFVVVGFGVDGTIIRPKTDTYFGLSLQGAFARTWVPKTEPLQGYASIVVGIEPYLRLPAGDFTFIPFVQISRAYLISRFNAPNDDKASTGFAVGLDVLLFRLTGTGVTLSFASTHVEDQSGFSLSIAILLLGRRAP